MEVRIVRDQFLHLGIGFVDIFRIAGKRGPAERANAAAEKRADISRHKSGEGKGIFKAFIQRNLTDIIAIIERRNTAIPKLDHRFHLHLHRSLGGFGNSGRVTFALGAPFGHGPALRQIAVHRIMR